MQKLALFSAIFLTFAICVTAVVFHYNFNRFVGRHGNFLPFLIGLVLVMAGLNYLLMSSFLSYSSKKQVQQITTRLPKEFQPDEGDEMNIRRFGEKVSEIRKRTETELDTMKEMEKYRKEYIGNISHELKTPLFSIQGYVETLLDGGIENLNIRDKYLERIDKSVERLLNIVTDLDMINQFESGELKLNKSDFDLNVLVKEVQDLLEIEASKKSSKIVTQTGSSIVMVRADKQKIAQVLINLVSNAIYYSNRENAQILIKTGYAKDKVVVEVSDNGMGIKPEVLPRIFERFYRVESSRNRREGGSGLGLAIVKHILEGHHQSITAQSVYLVGTSFTFTLDKPPTPAAVTV